MKAVLQDRYGPPDVLTIGEIDKPVVGENEVLLEVHAAGVSRGVWHLMTGQPYLMRILGFGLRAPKNRVPGMDVAGRVDAVGAGVTGFRAGDYVYGTCTGGFAEYARTNEASLVTMPSTLTFEQAASIPDSAVTALSAIRLGWGRDDGNGEATGGASDGRKGGESGFAKSVLILGASGGVGTYAVQIAKAFGAEVTGVCSTGKQDLVRSLGADRIIDYTKDDISAGGRRYDIILDIGGNRPLSLLRRILAPRGTLVFVGGEEGGRLLGGLGRQLFAVMVSPFFAQSYRMLVSEAKREDLIRLNELIEAGYVTPVIDAVYSLHEASAALRYLEEGRAKGKVVISVR